MGWGHVALKGISDCPKRLKPVSLEETILLLERGLLLAWRDLSRSEGVLSCSDRALRRPKWDHSRSERVISRSERSTCLTQSSLGMRCPRVLERIPSRLVSMSYVGYREPSVDLTALIFVLGALCQPQIGVPPCNALLYYTSGILWSCR